MFLLFNWRIHGWPISSQKKYSILGPEGREGREGKEGQEGQEDQEGSKTANAFEVWLRNPLFTTL